MPTYLIEGKRVKTDTPLSEDEIDEIASSISMQAPVAKATPAQPQQASEATVVPTTPDQSTAETARLGRAPQRPAPQGRSFGAELGRQFGLTARAGVTGATDLASMVLDPAVSLVNKAAGTNLPPPSSSLQGLMTRAGIPTPENDLERSVQTGASAVAGVGSQAKLALESGVALLKPFTKELGQQAAAAGASGAVSQAVSDNLSKNGISPEADFAATLASGMLAGALGAKTVRTATTPKMSVTSIDDVKREAGRAYTRVDDAGINVKPKIVLDAIDNIEGKLLNTANFNPQMDSHKPVQQVLDQLRQMVGTQRVSFTKMDQLRQTANDLARESTDEATRRLAKIVVEGIDNKITTLQPNDLITGKGNLTEALKDVKVARDTWRKAAKATLLEDALNVAEARALAPNASEGELIRTQFKQIAANKEKMRLFSEDEQTAIRKLVKGDGVQTLLSLAARFNPERSQLMAGAQLAGAVANPVAAGSIAAGGFAADKALGSLQRSQANKTISNILSGSTKAPRSTTEANLRALFEAGRTEPLDQEKKDKEIKKADEVVLSLLPTKEASPKSFRTEADMKEAAKGTTYEKLTKEQIVKGIIRDNPSITKDQLLRIIASL